MKKIVLIAALLATPALAMNSKVVVPAPAQVATIPLREYQVLVATYFSPVAAKLDAINGSIDPVVTRDYNALIVETEKARQAQVAGNRPAFDAAAARMKLLNKSVCGIIGC